MINKSNYQFKTCRVRLFRKAQYLIVNSQWILHVAVRLNTFLGCDTILLASRFENDWNDVISDKMHIELDFWHVHMVLLKVKGIISLLYGLYSIFFHLDDSFN